MIIVFNPEKPSDERDLSLWCARGVHRLPRPVPHPPPAPHRRPPRHEWFVSNPGLGSERCMVVSFSHGRSSRRADLRAYGCGMGRFAPSPLSHAATALRSVPLVEAALGMESSLQKGFKRWLPAVRARWEERSGATSEAGRRPGK